MTAAKWRQKHPRFVFRSCSWHYSQNSLNYSFEFVLESTEGEDINFTHSDALSGVSQSQFDDFVKRAGNQETAEALLDRLVFSIGLSLVPSYWKAACSPEIVIKAASLSKEQIAWWRRLWIKGLGEFFFVNGIKEFADDDFVKIVVVDQGQTQNQDRDPNQPINIQVNPDSVLIPVGGGKDSVVTLETLKKTTQAEQSQLVELGVFLFNPLPSALAIAQESGLPITQASRGLDQKLLELNSQGYLNGHTPFSAYLAFTATLAASVFGYQYLALSNERSANEGNIHFQGQEINHQYSKSFEFEQAFRTYCHQFLFGDNGPEYFSFLRPLYELQIGQLFAQILQRGKTAGGQAGAHSQHLAQSFISCNRGHRENVWCEECPKCLFVYAILYPFLEEAELRLIFSHDLFEDLALEEIAMSLANRGAHKPLECVGMYEESVVAFHLSYQKATQGGQTAPALLQKIHDQVLKNEPDLDTRAQAVLKGWSNQHALPEVFEKVLRQQLDSA